MKLKGIVFLVLIALFLTSCKIDKSNKDSVNQDTTKIKVESNVKVVLDMVVPKDDVFQIFYTEDRTPNCSEEKSVKTAVTGSQQSQKIIFELPEDLAINYIRIDVGENRDQGQMKMNGFLYQYFDKKIDLKANSFFQFYTPTEQIVVDNSTSSITPNIKGNERYDPIFYPMETFCDELEKVLK